MARDDEQGIAALASLRMGVRVDSEGILERDYHTVQNVPTTSGTNHQTAISQRYYLADALFLVVLEANDAAVLHDLVNAIHNPHWPLFLGRRAFVPSRPLVGTGAAGQPRTGAGVSAQPLEAVLGSHPWLELRPDVRHAERQRRAERPALRTVIDCEPDHSAAEMRYDVPISFDRANRRFQTRSVRTSHVQLTDELIAAEETTCI
jgi:CRISPR system Cascade subunit CasD